MAQLDAKYFILLLIVVIVVALLIKKFMSTGEAVKQPITGGADQPKHKRSLFIFRRDLRTVDNTALNLASKRSDEVVPVFIFDDKQISDSNKYKSDACVQFMIKSLEELNDSTDGALIFAHAKGNSTPADVVEDLVKELKCDAVYFNTDYSPYSKSRDKAIETTCKNLKVHCEQAHDCLLLDGLQTAASSGNVYKVFTPFHNAFKSKRIRSVDSKKVTNFAKVKSKKSVSSKDFLPLEKKSPVVSGGRKEALDILKNISEQKNYNSKRNNLTYATTRLSAHNKFGTVSVREVYEAFKSLPAGGSDLVKQLFWRDFYYNLLATDDRALRGNYSEKFDKQTWKNDSKLFTAWKKGLTGIPIVDAAMREIVATNFMHNRARMIVADCLIKLFNIDWRKGEQYFAETLVDYDPAQNYYNWQWVAGTGPFSQPYFRVFNPFTQAEKFDKSCEYIKRWVPELKDVPAGDILKWDTKHKDYDVGYPAPIIDYKKARDEFSARIKKEIK